MILNRYHKHSFWIGWTFDICLVYKATENFSSLAIFIAGIFGYWPPLCAAATQKKWRCIQIYSRNYLSENRPKSSQECGLSKKDMFIFQECKFSVGSYIHDATQIYFTGSFGHDVQNQRAQQYAINITALDEKDRFFFWAERNFSYTGFQVRKMLNEHLSNAFNIHTFNCPHVCW